jgi:hypothetical protein
MFWRVVVTRQVKGEPDRQYTSIVGPYDTLQAARQQRGRLVNKYERQGYVAWGHIECGLISWERHSG